MSIDINSFISKKSKLQNIIPANDDELWFYIWAHLGYKIPRVKVCKDHDSPFSFISHAFFEKLKTALLVANRGGGKTQMLAVLHALNSKFKKKCRTVHMGSVESQAQECYGYFKDIVTKPNFKDDLHSDPLLSKTFFKNGSKVEIICGTINQASSKHPQKSVADEVEELGWDVWQQFLPTARYNHGIMAQTIAASTQRAETGTVNKIIKSIKGEGIMNVYRYCWREVAERCTRPSCDKCLLFEPCHAKHDRPICKETNGYLKIDDIEMNFMAMDEYTWNVQMETKEPSRLAGAIYYKFDDLNINPTNIPVDYSKPLIWTLDFNVNPMCSVIIQHDKNKIYIKDEIVLMNSSTPESVEEFERRYLANHRDITVRIYGDAAGNSRSSKTGGTDYDIIRTMLRKYRNVKICVGESNPGIKDRENAVNMLLENNLHERTLMINPQCKTVINDFREFTDKAKDKMLGHISDAVGYYLYTVKDLFYNRHYDENSFYATGKRLTVARGTDYSTGVDWVNM